VEDTPKKKDGYRKLHYEELHVFCSSPNVGRVISEISGNVACMREEKCKQGSAVKT